MTTVSMSSISFIKCLHTSKLIHAHNFVKYNLTSNLFAWRPSTASSNSQPPLEFPQRRIQEVDPTTPTEMPELPGDPPDIDPTPPEFIIPTPPGDPIPDPSGPDFPHPPIPSPPGPEVVPPPPVDDPPPRPPPDVDPPTPEVFPPPSTPPPDIAPPIGPIIV